MITQILKPFLAHRHAQIVRRYAEAERTQLDVLLRLTQAARATEWGCAHGFGGVARYEDFAAATPLTDYEALKADIDRMRHGGRDVLWPGRVKWYAKSSGTTNDKSKFIPVSPAALRDTHYRGGTDAVALYLHNHPASRVMDGSGLILGGSHQPNYNLRHSLVGDLSAILIENISPAVNLLRVPSKCTALLADFEQKRDRIAREAVGRRVTSLSGVPSWMMSVLTRVLELTGKDCIKDVWPRLEVFFHGGVAFTPYREQYLRIIGGEGINYEETYNASEGFFGLQDDPDDKAMLLMLDYGVFYEFIPLDEVGKENPTVLPLWGVEAGKNYALVITTSSGLWRYQIGDTVRFTSTRPYKFVISGRTKSFINAFGEELIVDNAERGLQRACAETGAAVREYTAAPVFMDEGGKCRHQWVVEFDKTPADPARFADVLDRTLQELNSDYEAKRYKNLTLQPLELIVARQGLFEDWLRSRGKMGGQHKVPRLCNDRRIIDEILALA
ncbi:MAG: GH3 auxin-responsive promoter family protein [Bacteroidaceae bacterium]|nr:GH3 auxin-responsive promoter family protein [Bacteroidaceae bacterium]